MKHTKKKLYRDIMWNGDPTEEPDYDANEALEEFEAQEEEDAIEKYYNNKY